MKPHRQICLPSLTLPPIPFRPGEAQQPGTWNWQSEPEQWARSIRQQLDAQLLVVSETRVDSSPKEAFYDALESQHQQRRQEQFLQAVTQALPGLRRLVSELRTLFSAVLQDGSLAAWHYLHTVLRLLPPYRALLVGHLDLLPFLEQLYRWAPWVQTQLQLDLLNAIDQAFPRDTSLLESASHVDCCLQKPQRSHHGPPVPACPFVRARRSGQQEEEKLATWLRPLTLPELQHSLGIVGAEVALNEAQWRDGLGLLPLALATDIPVQYESDGTDDAEEELVGRRKTKSRLDSEVSGKTFKKSSTGGFPPTSLLGSQAMAILKTERYLKKIHFLYLNVAPSRYFRPYSLVVVPPNKVNPEHYIFSPFGILHVHPEEATETMTLGTWHRHFVLWQQLQLIPFFKFFLLRKAWACWRKTVKFQRLHRCRTFLGRHLLFAVPHFGVALLHISRLLQELHSVSWLPQEPDQCYELLDLQRALAQENQRALQLLSRCLHLCKSILDMVHEDTYQMQQGLQERVRNCKRIRTDQGSIYLQKVQGQQLEQKLKRVETWLLQLGQLARLVHYMICQNLVSIIEEKITSFVANILKAPRQNPFLSAQLVFDSCGQLSHDPCIEDIIQIITGGLQFVKASALKVMKSTDLKSSGDSLNSEEEDEEEALNTENLMPRSQGDAVQIFCGPNVGLVWPWKSHTITEALEVRGHRLRSQYLPPNYKQLQEDLNNNPRIQHALAVQQALLEDMLWEVQEFCRDYHWMTGIYKFLQAWGPQKLESMRGCPINNYETLVSHLDVWQARVSCIPIELITKGKLLLLSCGDIQANLESKLESIRKEILEHVQGESWSRSQQLMKELTDFIEAFQTINSDIHTIARCSQKLNKAHEQYSELEERMEYIRALHELIRNHFSLFSAETEALDISLLDLWEAFQFERSQASEFLLSKRHAIIPKLQQLMAAALAELEGLIGKAVSSPFMDPAQEQKSMENQLIALGHQFQDTTSYLSELHHAYSTFTGDESPVPLPICGIHPILQQQSIWHLYRVISEHISDWKCIAFAKFSLPMAQEKIEGWLTEAAQINATVSLHSPVLQYCIHILEEFHSYLPLLTKLSSLQLHGLNFQSLIRALGLGSLNVEFLTLGQLLTCPLLDFADQINQIWRNENEYIHAQEALQQLQQVWEARQLRLLNFILQVPCQPSAPGRSKRQMLRRDIMAQDSGTFILSDYNSLQDSAQESLQVLFKILAIQKSGDLYKRAVEWMTILHDLSDILQVWVTFQQKWIFLNKVLHEMKIQFPSSDLNSRFKAVDDQYRTLMQTSVADPLVLSLVVPSGQRNSSFQGQKLQQMLQAGSAELEGIITALKSVLYEFCVHFPRLFFLSDSELVDLLVARLEPGETQIWVRRCFPHVLAVSFQSSLTGEDTDAPDSRPGLQTQVEGFAVLGAGGEKVKLQQPLLLHPDLPRWLASLEKGLRLSLVHMLQGCVAARLQRSVALAPSLDKELPQRSQLSSQMYVYHWLDLVKAFPWQCVLVAEEVVWRAEMEEALLEGHTLTMVRTHVCKLEVLVHFVRTQKASLGGQPLPSVRETSLLSALVAMAVTHRDIAQLLKEHKVSDLADFHWARQLKYHLGSSHIISQSPLQSLRTIASTDTSLSPAACWIDVLGRSFLYNYEYLGPRLGSLPSLLPEWPALTLLLALEEVACGTLLGPDGMGKAAMVKSLAQALGRQLVMIPCLPQIGAQSLSNYLNGALQGGAWLLLEAAQHLPLGLLSALGQRLAELHSLYAPLYRQVSRSTSTINPTHSQLLGRGFFEKNHVDMRLGYGCLLTLRTLSPALPANLRLLLRPVALTLPNLQQVAEMTLLGAGMREASLLATRLSKFFSLERELVSGPLPCRLPLLKRVLADMIQALNVAKEEPKPQLPLSLAATQERALLHALLRSPLFSILDGVRLHHLRELLCGTFPRARQVLAEPVTPRLRKPLLVEELQQAGLHPNTDILGSLEQLSQALGQTSGILLLGPAGSGKTTCWHSLFMIQNRLAAMEDTSTQGYLPVEITHLYPSVLSPEEFLGWQEGPCWHQGVLPRLLRATSQCKTVDPKSNKAQESVRTQHWVICDGVSSAAWLDSVTCLLRDPPQLILPSGQQVERSPDTFLLMEVGDATGMPPAVVGRCALVWCGGEQTWKGMLRALMAALPQEYCLQPQTVTELNHLAEVLVPATFQFLTRQGASSVLQAHGQKAVCPGVAEITSLARLLRCLLDPHLRIDEETHVPEELSHSDSGTPSFKSSKSSSLTRSQADSSDVPNKRREHLLVVSSFLFALIWGFGAHLPSRLWPVFDTFLRDSINYLPNYPEPSPSASVFDLHLCPEDGTLVPFNGQYVGSRIKGSLGTFSPSPQTERLFYVVDLLLTEGHPVLLAGEAATGKSAFVEVLVEPHHPYIYTPIHPAFSTTYLRLLLSRGVQSQSRTSLRSGQHLNAKGSLLFLLEDLHLAASDPEKSCQPVLETLRQAMNGTVCAHSTLELQTLQPIVNFLATATVPGFSECPLCPRLFRLFTVLALADMTKAMLLSRHTPIIQAWLERFPCVEREGVLARALICASMEAWEIVSSCFLPSPLHPHYRFSLHSVSQLLGSLQLLPTRTGSRGFLDYPNHQEHLRRVSGLRGTRLMTMMAMRNMVRLWLHEAQRTFCDRLDSPRERDYCAKLLLEVAQSVFCCGSVPQSLDKGSEEEEELEEEEESVPEVESEGELAQWEDLSSSSSETEEEDTYDLWVTTGPPCSDSDRASSIAPVERESTENISQKINQEEDTRASSYKLQIKRFKNWWQKTSQLDLDSPLLLPVLLLCPQEKPSDLIFSQELIVGSNSESPNMYLERQWESLEEQLATSAAQLKLSPHLARCHSMAQHVARLVRVLARPRQHGLLVSEALGTGRCTAIILAANISQARIFYLPCQSEKAILQCLWDASWHAGMLGQPVALLVPNDVDLTTLHRLLALASSGSFPDQYTEAHLEKIEEHLRDVKQTIKKEMLLQRFYQQVCSHLHMFILIGDDQAHKQLPSTLFRRLLQLAITSIDHYEPWDQDSLISVAQHHLDSAQNLPLGDDTLKYPDLQASIPNVAKAMAFIHLSAASYHGHLCPELPLVTPKTFLDFLETFMLLQQQMILQMKNKAQRFNNALGNLTTIFEQHNIQTNQVSILKQEMKDFHKKLSMLRQQLEQSKILHKRQLAECRQQETLIRNLTKQWDALRAQHEVFLDQMGKAFLGPLSQLKVSDFEEIRSYRAPPESVIQVTNALCDLFHRERGWASAKQLLCTEDFYQELVFFPKEKMTASEVINLSVALKAPGMSDAALRAVSTPAASLAAWLWAVLRYRLAQHRGLPTGLLLRQVEATLAREQAQLAHYQFQAKEILERSLALTKQLEDIQASHGHLVDRLSWTQTDQYHTWPIKTALLAPMHSWTAELQKLKKQCMTVFGDALLCSAAIVYLGPFPPLRRQELLAKWLALCKGFQETLGPDDVAQALKQNQKSVITPPKQPLLSTCSPFSLLSLLSSESEQFQWDRDLKPQAKSARLAGLLLRSCTHYFSCRWPLVLDPSKQALIWLNPLPLEHTRWMAPVPTTDRGKGDRSQEKEYKEDAEEEDNDSEKSPKVKEQKAEEKGKEEVIDKEEKQEQENKEDETERQESRPASETQSPPFPYLSVLSGSDPDLGPQLLEAAAKGLPVLLTNVELGLGCQELPWLLQREQLSPPQVQPGFCLYLSTTLPLGALKKGCELLKVLNVLDLGLNMDILEEQMLHEILCTECPKFESRWQNLQMKALDTLEAVEATEERLLRRLLSKNPTNRHLAKFLRDMVRNQAELCQLLAYREELEDLRLQEMVKWVPYQHVVQHGIAIIRALSPLQDLLPPFRMSPENWLAATKRALNSMKQCENHPGKDLNSHLLQLKTQLTRQLLCSTVAALGLSHMPLVGAFGALALLCEARKAPHLERLAFWPGLEASPSIGSSKPVPGVARPAWLGVRAWHECGILELLPPFSGLRVSLAGHSSVWQSYLSLSSTVLGPTPGPGPNQLSLLQKLILWRVLRPECLAGALADFTTSLLGRPLDENLSPSTIPFEHSQATQPLLVLLPPPGHPTATLHPLAVIQKLAAQHEQGQKHLEVIALGSEAWNPVSVVVSTLCQAMYKGHWLVLENCHLMPHWPRELLQPLLGLLDGAEVSDLELELLLAPSASRNMVHKDFRLWLIVSAESIASLPAVLTQHCMPVFWEQSLELGHVLLDNVELAQQELYVQPLTRTMPLLLLHGLLLHRQLYGMKLQAHRGHWNQVTLTQVLQMQDQLWASLSNPHAAMEELAASVFYGGPVGDNKDREALISLIRACLSPSRGSWDQPHTPQYLLATLIPSPDLEELDAMSECKAQMHQLPTPPEPRTCGLSAGPQAWLLRRRSRALLRALQQCSLTWVSVPDGSRHTERQRRLRQRLVLAKQTLESLQALLTQTTLQESGASGAGWLEMGSNAGRAVEGFLQMEVQELSQLVSTLQGDLNCLLQQLEGAPPCLSQRCVAVANALWTGRLPLPWRRHAPAWLQPPWHWLRQLSRRGQLLVRYLGVGTAAPKRSFHLSAFRHPHRLLLSLRWEAAFAMAPLDHHVPGGEGLSSRHFPHKHQELNSNPLHLQVVSSPKPTVPETGTVLLIGLQLWNAQWDPLAGALKDGPTSQPSPLPPVSVSTQAQDTNDLPPAASLAVYSCPVYMEGPLGTARLHSKNILMYLPMPTKLSPAICVQRRVHVCSPPLS